MDVRRIFLIDGTAFCYRAFYAIRNLATADGRPTNAVYGFAAMLNALRQKEHPDGLAVAFDVGKPTFRHAQFEDYKSHRKPMPEALICQLPVIRRLLEGYRVPVFEQEGFEGEDILGSMARRLAGPGTEVLLVTGDKDALQLVSEHVKVYNPHKDAVVDAKAVEARYGVAPERMVDLMALMGDDTDGIPGVTGIGEKTARELLGQFGSLDALYRRLDEIPQAARRKTLAAGREQAELSRALARINTDVPVPVQPEDLAPRDPDWPALRALFREMEFKKLAAEAEAAMPVTPPQTAVRAAVARGAEWRRCLEALAQAPCAALAGWVTEGAPEAPVILAVAAAPEAAWIIVLDRDTLAGREGAAFLTWLADPARAKLGHDLKRLARQLGARGGTLAGVAGDTMLAGYLLNPARSQPTLGDLTDEYLDERLPAAPPPEAAAVRDPAPEALEALARRTTAVFALHDRLFARLDASALAGLYRELEVPLLEVLGRMEAVGVAVDVPYLAALRQRMDGELARLSEEIHRLAGGPFNVNSPKQLAQVLFERLGLPVIKRTKTGPSTDSDVLRRLAEAHPLPRQLMAYRELAKLVSTYVETLPTLADGAGRVHTSFNQTATATGRLSSSDPNLQNIPVRTELGRSIRRAFIAGGPERILLAADYSQIELRILAHCAGDAQLTAAFREGRDIHRYTASLIYGLPETEVQPEQRSAMKAVNFGILYGMTAHGLSKELGMAPEEAQRFIEAYFVRYPSVRAYLDSQIAQARAEGFVQTLLGRRRYVPEVNSSDGMLRQMGERMAVNAPIQGTAADIIKRAMVRMEPALAAAGLSARMVLQVHDELVFEAPRGEQPVLAEVARRTMEGAFTLSVPLTVSLKAGTNWLEMAPLA